LTRRALARARAVGGYAIDFLFTTKDTKSTKETQKESSDVL